jgi:hypothetical protein
MLNEHHSSHLN